jgi:hypothetical protein
MASSLAPFASRALLRSQRFKGLSVISAAKQSLIGPYKTTTPGTYDTARIRHDNLTGKPVSSLSLVYANYAPAGSTEVANPNGITVQAAIERLSNNGATVQDQPCVPVYAANGLSGIYSGFPLDRRVLLTTIPVPFFVPPSGTVFERTAVTPTTGTAFPRGGCLYGGTGTWATNNGEGATAGQNYAAGLTINENPAVYYYSASALLGALSDGSVATSVALIGDSIMVGTDDAGFGGGFVGGPGQRIFSTTPHILLGCPGEKLADIAQPSGLTGNFFIRGALMGLCTHVVSNYGRNDVEQGQTLSQYKANLLALALLCMASGQHFAQMTIFPAPTSTDGWFTATNQTAQDATTKDPLRNSINSWLRDTSSSGFVAQANAQVTGYAFPGQAAIIDISAPIECNASGVLTAGGNLILGSQSAVAATGTATAATSTSITLGSANWTPTSMPATPGFAGYGLYVVSGTGAGQMRGIVYNSATMLTTDLVFTTTPDTTSVFKVYLALGMNGVHALSTGYAMMAAATTVQAQAASFLALP